MHTAANILHGRALQVQTVLNGAWTISPFTLFLVELIIIVSIARILAYLLKFVGQPGVVAEILAGIVIGPTVLGRAPGFSANVFPPDSVATLGVIANIGLVFFLFNVGIELDAGELKENLKMSLFIPLFGIGVPLIAGVGMAFWLLENDSYVVPGTSLGVMIIFLTNILATSALPVLARILSERDMLGSRLAIMSMSVSAIDDVIVWILLAVMLALVGSAGQLGVIYSLLLIVAECLFIGVIVRRALAYIAERDGDTPHIKLDSFLYVVGLLFVSCYFAEIIGLSSLIGAFQVGLVVPRGSFSKHIVDALTPISATLFMPLYFAFSGLRTNFGLIDSGEAVAVAVALIVVATISKIIGVMIPTRMVSTPWRISLLLGVLLSCKGLLALVIVNFGLSVNIITPKLFAILILLVLVTTMQTVPLVLLVDPPSRAAQSAAEQKAWEDSSGDIPPLAKQVSAAVSSLCRGAGRAFESRKTTVEPRSPVIPSELSTSTLAPASAGNGSNPPSNLGADGIDKDVV